MSPEKQRIAIAEACGWTNIGWNGVWGGWVGYKPETARDDYALPDYHNDLNACHEFEEKLIALGPPALDTYEIFLLAICTRAGNRIFRATAPQRCEAFLKTIKWRGENGS